MSNTEGKEAAGLPLVECFLSLQGEGFYAGSAAAFVRLAGCRNACAFCDTPQSWDEKMFARVPEADIVEKVAAYGCDSCVVTGGEPLLHNLDGLCAELGNRGIARRLETSGSEKLSGEWDWICLSPKRGVKVEDEVYRRASELKVVIGGESDFDFALSQARSVSRECRLYLQPEWSVRETITPHITAFILQHPAWRLSLQIHKIAGFI